MAHMAADTIAIPPRRTKTHVTDDQLAEIEKSLSKLAAGQAVVVGEADTQGKAYSQASRVRNALRDRNVNVKSHAVPDGEGQFIPAVSNYKG